MAQFRIRDNPNNSFRQQLQTRESPAGNPPWVKLATIYVYQVTRPLLLAGDDPDPPLIQFFKIAAGETVSGFADQAALDTWAGGVDLEALAITHGTTLENLAQGTF